MDFVKLSQVNNIFTGLPSAKLQKQDALGDMRYASCQLIGNDCISKTGEVVLDKATQVWVDEVDDRLIKIETSYILQPNDILVTLKGGLFKAGLFKLDEYNDKESGNQKTEYVVASNLAIIRQNDFARYSGDLLPEVVCAYLNSDYFKSTVIYKTKTHAQLITITDLKKVSIQLPDRQVQENIQHAFYHFQSLNKSLEQLKQQHLKVNEAFLIQNLNLSGKTHD